jgi:uncharacterized protein YbjQ (UPF0145 family)
MREIIVSTTNILDGYRVTKYLNLITTSVVLGTSIISDFFASLSDISGGRSNTYQNKLQDMYQIAIQQLKEEASKVSANCILGIKIDLDEISGKGMQMFMLNATGTAVEIISEEEYQKNKDQIVESRRLEDEKKQNDLSKSIKAEERARSAKTIDDLLQIEEIQKEANTIMRLYGEARYNHFLKSKAREYGIEVDE